MLNNPFLRLLIALGIAIPIVYALFMMMSYLISVKEVKLDQSEQRVLSAITPQQQDADDPVAISDRDAQPIRPPAPSYPQRAAERGTEGSCDVRFDVDTRGRPYNISATCTDSVFKREAERAVSKVEFAPKIIRGKAAERRNVVYPLEFKLAD